MTIGLTPIPVKSLWLQAYLSFYDWNTAPVIVKMLIC